jgi:flagellum-specific peptidoglycan hydrolase FlgJ
MTKKQNVKVCYHKERTKKSRFRSKSALVLALFVANAVHTSGVIPVISDGIVAYADVHYSYSPDDDCGVNQDSQTKNNSSKNKDSSSSNKVSRETLKDTEWTKKGTKAYQNAIDTINFWKEQGLSGVEIAGIIGNIGGAENTTFTLDLREEGGGSGGLYRFNPSSKYTSWSGFDGKWSARNQGEFVLYSEPQSVLAYINKKNTSPSQSAEDWANLYERPDAGALANSLQARKDASEKAYKVFELDKIEGDSKKVSTWGGSNVSQDKKVKISAEDGNKKGTKIDLKVAIKWFEEREGKVTYSQDAGSRKGPLQYDCSSAIYMALVAGGAGKTAGDYPVSTETEHEWLLQNGFNKVYEGKWGDKGDVKEVKKGDIIIWGTKGSSGGDLGHTMIMYDNETIIHSSAGHNGIARDTYSKYRDEATDHQTVYVYRYSGSTNFSEDDVEKVETKCKPKCAYNDSSERVKGTNSSTDSSTSTSGSKDTATMLNEFAKKHEQAYVESWRVGGFLPSASIIQTMIETSFNESVPSFGQAHNMGGVKTSKLEDFAETMKLYGKDAVAFSGAGTTVGDNTGGTYTYFKSFDAGIVGKAEFMARQTLYDGAINNTDAKAVFKAIADGGWATDSSYQVSLNKMYDQYGEQLKWLDEKAIAKYGKTPFKKGSIAESKDKAVGAKMGAHRGTAVCDTNSSSGGGDGWQKAGGSTSYTSNKWWKKDDLPPEMQQYALDPTSIGLKWRSKEGWEGASAYIASGYTDQCTTLASACFGALWEKDGKPMGDSHGMTGNGVEMAKQVASKFGKSTTSTPTSGDIVSLQPNHVAIVSHVFDNGDILLVEQNVPNYSGNGDSFTWNYSYITKATQKAKNYEFWNPSSEGYKVTSKAKSVG